MEILKGKKAMLEQELERGKPITMSIEDMARVLGIGRNKAHDMLKMPGFPVLKLGRRKLIPIKGLEAWIEKQAQNDNL